MARFLRFSLIFVSSLIGLVLIFQPPTTPASGHPFACGPAPTPEVMEVQPVTSPTMALTQTLFVRLGNGRAITATSEAGSAAITGTFSSMTWMPITISLQPNVTHHVVVTGQVEYATGCFYTLYRTADTNNQPLTIVQVSKRLYLPVVLRGGTPARSFPDTTNGIYVLNDQLATWSMSEAQFQFAATHYVGTQKVTRDQARHLRQYNPNFLVLHYRLAQALGHSIPNASCQPTTDYLQIIDGDQWVQEWPGNATVQEPWFYHYPSTVIARSSFSRRSNPNTSGEEIASRSLAMTPTGARVFSCTDGHYLMELNDTGWREWWSTQVISQLINNENDTVFADSFSVPNYFGHCVYQPCLPDVNASFEQEWADREYAFTEYMQARFASRWKWLPNIGAWITSRDPSDYSNLDGAMLEGFAEWGGSNYFDPSDWKLQMNRVLPLIRADKIIIGQTYPNEANVNERLFVLGTYLLIKGTHTYLNMDIAMEPEWFPEYAIDLGSPIDPLPVTIDGFLDATSQLYVRHYAQGMVIVNPSADAHAINLGGTFQRVIPIGGGLVPDDGTAPGSISYAAVTSINLGANQAAIVLNALP